MNTKPLIALIAGLIGLMLVAAAQENAASRAAQYETSIRSATNIVFRQWVSPSMLDTNEATWTNGPVVQQFTVNDSAEAKRLTSSVRLGAEGHNGSDFLLQAEFQGPSGTIQIQFSKRYFVVIEPPSSKDYNDDHTYDMPKEFYEQFQQAAARHHWETVKKQAFYK
jgi:hypothetical protein